jgi:predicted metalloprotease with PDZ domain
LLVHRLVPAAIAALLGIATVLMPAAARADRYNVSITLGSAPHAHVEARLAPVDGKLFMHSHAGGYEWSDYIQNLRASQDGHPLDLERTGKESWAVNDAVQTPIDVSYDVDLGFTVPEREGAQRGGQSFGDSLYLVDRVLFVMDNAPGPKDVALHLPPGAKVATPWQRLSPALFRAATNSDLVDNTLVIGRFPEIDVKQGTFDIDFVLPGATAAEGRLMEPVVRNVLHEYLRMFPETPPFDLVMSYFRGVEVNGEGYRNAATLTFPGSIGIGNRDLWANYIAHELFHHWNATLIFGAESGADEGSTEWFSEGATEYIANRTLLRSGRIDPEGWLRHMEANVALYKFWTWAAPFAGTSIVDAGSKTALPRPKGVEAKTYNRAGVYNGGWVASFCIDSTIASATHGHRDIDDLLRILLDDYGLKGRAWKNSDLIAEVSKLAGRDLGPELTTYLQQPKPLPVEKCWAKAGLTGYNLDYSGETRVAPDPHASVGAKRVLHKIWRGE